MPGTRLCLPSILLLACVHFAAVPAYTQREPVLKQIDLPHPYYFREMYLPQLTTGPSAAAWLPDSRSLIYSMAGSLWRQRLDSTITEQLTAGPGYDYQPDVSPDGNWIVFATYDKDAIELWALDLETGQKKQLTSGGAVNVEPRFSPDGRRLAFVSTSYHGHFHIFIGEFRNGDLTNVRRLTGETRSSVPRYYYSQFDHEISPAWSPDGAGIIFVSNRGHIYGTGGFWRGKAAPGAEPREIHYEETAWKARPDFSPDGTRIVYASYLGAEWHQLWVMPSQGGDAFPLSYGEFDNINPRWSPDGKRIAFISNRGGNTSLWVHDVLGGAQTRLTVKDKRYLRPMAHLSLTVLDANGKPAAARVFVTGYDGRAYAPDEAWMHADDNFDRAEGPFEAHYYHAAGSSELAVPAGRVSIEAMKGFEFSFEKRPLDLAANQQTQLTIRLKRLDIPREAGHRWVSADLHVHMNYGGAYRNTPKNLVAQAAAENLAIVEDLVVNKEQRIPDITYFSPKPDPASTPNNLLFYGQEFHTSYWGHLGLLHLTHFLIPDFAAYPGTAAASLYPGNAEIADLAHEQQAVVGYVHPYDTFPDPLKDESLTHELPVDVALGKVDYIEVLGFSDHKSTAAVWYKLLNCGFRLPAAAGTDAMANFASLRGPVGLNRVYADVPAGPVNINSWLSSLKSGKTFATNGPLLNFTLGGRQIGDDLRLQAADSHVKFSAWLRSFVPVERLEIVCNGQVVQQLSLSSDRQTADATGTLPIRQSGWCILRASSDHAKFPILDAYPYATTSPIYISLAGSPLTSPDDAAYFVAWIDRLIQAANSNRDWNNDTEKVRVMQDLNRARTIYAQRQK